ncbi:MAG: hypothetical protein IT206_09240 [Fimbriimonadaceae bacterium]|nr:hypothetical protein [Fimbriimonadaceae bacterium]
MRPQRGRLATLERQTFLVLAKPVKERDGVITLDEGPTIRGIDPWRRYRYRRIHGRTE